jgi:hypothetical protein
MKRQGMPSSQLNPVDAVLRMAAHVSGFFTSIRCCAAARSVVAPPSADGPFEFPKADHLALKLREIKISDDAAVLADMTTKLQRAGIFGMEDLQGLSLDEVNDAVAAWNLNAMQLRRLFAAVSNI